MSSLEDFLNHAKERDELCRWVNEQDEGADIIILSYHQGTHKHACTGNIDLAKTNFMLDIFKTYLLKPYDRD